MRRVLKIPLDITARGIERKYRAGVEVVARSQVTVPVRRGVADRPVQQIELGIVGAGQPGRAAACLPAISAPGVAARLAGRRDRELAPESLARRGIVGIDEPADARLGATHPDNDLAVDCQRRERQGKADIVVGNDRVPAHGTCRGIERDNMCIEGADINRIIEHRDTAIDLRETDVLGFRVHVGRPGPEHLAGCCIERRYRARRLGEIHDAVDDDRRRLDQPGTANGRGLHLVRPDHFQVCNIVLVDLLQRRITFRTIGARISQPVVRLIRGVDETFETDLRIRGSDEACKHQKDDPFHHSLLRLIM